MPDILTHILCGHDTIQSLEGNWKAAITEKQKLFNLGCQGPDVFFYNDFMPFSRQRRGLKYGKLMHLEKTGDFLVESIDYIKKNSIDKEDFNTLFVYISGLICHFGLDRNAHPYIYYYAGKYEKDNPETRKYSGYHKRLELIIDTILIEEKKGLKSYRHPVYKEIDIGASIPKSIVKYYVETLSKIYNPKEIINFINDSYKDMKEVLKLAYDPIGTKKVLMKTIDKIIKGDIEYHTLIYPRRINSKHDYLNKNHNRWNHPCDDTESFFESFYDIYDLSVKESFDMIKTAIDFLEGKNDINKLKKAFPNVSYNTGRNTDDKCKLIYYKPIFDR